MEELFVPYNIAVKLKEKGFNEPCFATYNDNTKELYLELPKGLFGSTIHPTWLYQQVVDWFREKHDIEVSSPALKLKDKGKFYGGYLKHIDWDFGKSYGSNYKSYYEAYNKAIEESLKHI